MSREVQVRFCESRAVQSRPDTHLVALCHTREQAETVVARLQPWLKERGLSLNQEKTRSGRVDAGFDFLSFTIRRYHVRGGAKVLCKPSRTALKKIQQRLAQELRSPACAAPTRP